MGRCGGVFPGLLLLFLPILSCGTGEAVVADHGGPVAAGSTEAELGKEAAPVPEAEPLPGEPDFPLSFRLKSGPPDMELFYNGVRLEAAGSRQGLRTFLLEGPGVLGFRAGSFRERRLFTHEIPGLLQDGELRIRLERDGGLLELVRELPTGRQPKSVCFSPEGDRLFLPLLDDPGIDVFRVPRAAGGAAPVPVFERRMTVPGSSAKGFVEALCDGRRREFLVSNMEQNLVHVFDLDSLEYKSSFPSGGRMPKVIAQNPAGTITAVSNWLSGTVCLFDAGTKERLAVIPAGGTPRGMAFSADGLLLYAAIFDAPLVAVIGLGEKKVLRSFRFHEGAGAARHVICRGDRLYVSDMYRGTVSVLSTGGRVLRSARVGPNLNTIALSPDGAKLYVSSRGRNNPDDYTLPGPEFGAVSALSAGDLSLLDRVWGGNQPTGLAVSPDGSCLAFTDFLDANLEFYRVQ